MEVVRTDVLVIGAGIAGLRAAAAASESGARVTVVCKGEIGRSGNSFRASGGFAAAVSERDHWQEHQIDFEIGGYRINHPVLCRLVAHHAPELLLELSQSVSGFESNRQGLIGRPVPAHKHPRSVQFLTGMPELLRQLCRQLFDNEVELWSNLQVIELVHDQVGDVCGAHLFDPCRGAIILFVANAVVLASGGCGGLFPVTSNDSETVGDTYALALAAGCSLRDMEFIQFTPTAFATPEKIRGRTIVGSLLTLPGVRLLNVSGDRFMHHYDRDRMEQADRAVLARAIATEVRLGRGTESGGVYLDLQTVDPADLDRHRPGFLKFCLNAGIDPGTSMLETAPSAHTCLGGVNVNGDLEAKAGLFVCGEALGGTHGANRLSSNSLSEALVTGYFAGKNATEKSIRKASSHTLEQPYLPASGGVDLTETRTRLITLVGECAGVERCGQRIEEGLQTLSDLSAEISSAGQFGVSDQKAWYDLRSMIMVARAIFISALTREESRGAHFRTDYAEQDDLNWSGNILLTGGAEMRARYVPVTNEETK